MNNEPPPLPQLQPDPKSKRARLTVLQGLIVCATVLLGSIVSCEIDARPFGFAELLGASLFPFAAGMALALGLKGWRGTIAAILLIVIFHSFAIYAVLYDRAHHQ